MSIAMVQRSRFTSWRQALSALVLAVVVSGLAGASRAAEGPPTLLLLPIVVHSAEDPKYLRAGLSDMLTARFSRIGALALVRNPEPDGLGTTDLDEARELGRKAGADFVLYGSFTRFGQGASLDVQCAPTDEEMARAPLREIFVHSGSIGEIIPDLDELAGKVSRFAKGEIITPAALAAAGGPAGLAPPAEGMAELTARVEALEAAITQLLETDIEAEDIETDIP